MRNYYLKKNSKTVFDKTPFQEYSIDCIGETIDPNREALLVRKKKFLERKGVVVYKYKPDKDRNKNEKVFMFPNTSGNEINNPRNYRIPGDVPRSVRQENTSDEPEVSGDLEIKDIEKAAKK